MNDLEPSGGSRIFEGGVRVRVRVGVGVGVGVADLTERYGNN